MWRTGRHGLDRGVAAVEFALVVPLFLLLLCGFIDFSRAYNVQLTLSDAAAEGSRMLATGTTVTTTQTAVRALVAPMIISFPVSINCPVTATPGTTQASMTVATTYTFITPVGFFMDLFDESAVAGVTIRGTAARQCAN